MNGNWPVQMKGDLQLFFEELYLELLWILNDNISPKVKSNLSNTISWICL